MTKIVLVVLRNRLLVAVSLVLLASVGLVGWKFYVSSQEDTQANSYSNYVDLTGGSTCLRVCACKQSASSTDWNLLIKAVDSNTTLPMSWQLTVNGAGKSISGTVTPQATAYKTTKVSKSAVSVYGTYSYSE